MPQHATDHPGHTGHTLKEDKPGQPFLLVHLEFGRELLTGLWMLVSRHKIHGPSEDTHGTQRHPVRPVGSLAVCNLHSVHLLLGVPGLRISSC